jgi:hypothetical protein
MNDDENRKDVEKMKSHMKDLASSWNAEIEEQYGIMMNGQEKIIETIEEEISLLFAEFNVMGGGGIPPPSLSISSIEEMDLDFDDEMDHFMIFFTTQCDVGCHDPMNRKLTISLPEINGNISLDRNQAKELYEALKPIFEKENTK